MSRIEPKYRWEVALAGLLHDIGKFYQKSEDAKIGKVKIYRQAIEHTLIAEEFINAHKGVFEKAFNADEIKFITECAVRHHSNTYSYKGDSSRILTSQADDKYKRYCYLIDKADNISSSERSETYSARDSRSSKENASLEPPFVRLNTDRKADDLRFISKAYRLSKWSDMRFNIDPIGRYHKNYDMTAHVKAFDTEFDRIKASSKEELFNNINSLIKEYTWCIPSDAKEIVRDVSLYQHLVTTSAIAVAIYNKLQSLYGENFPYSKVAEQKNSIALLNIKLDGALDYIFNVNKGSDILDIINAKNYNLRHEYSKLLEDLINGCYLTNTNIVINSAFESTILVDEAFSDYIKDRIRDINSRVIDRYKAECYIAYSLDTINFEKDINSNYARMAPLFRHRQSELNGIVDLLTHAKTWDTSKMILENDGDVRCSICGKPSNNEICGICNNELQYAKDNPDTADFDYFKESIKEEGMNKVGFILLKLDNFDGILNKGFGEYETISRVSTYLSLIGTFFNEYLNDKLGDCYFVNISDNSLIIAVSSDKIIETIYDIEQEFSKFTMGRLTLSIASCIVNTNDKLFTLVEDLSFKIDKLGNDKVLFRDLVIDSEMIDRYLEIKGYVLDSLDSGVDRGIIGRLSTYSKMYKEYLKQKDVENLLCISLFEKNKRRDSKSVSIELLNRISESFENIFRNPSSEDIDMTLYMLGTIISDTLGYIK